MNLPTCLTAMSRKTAASTMMGMYVLDLFYCTVMRIVIPYGWQKRSRVQHGPEKS
ncbi:MAG: hypothetical protein WCX22_09650 [Methanoregula sp.]